MITARDLQTDPLSRSGRVGPLRRDATLTGSLFAALIEPALPLRITVDANGSPPPWIGPALRRLAQIANLPENWDSYGAQPVGVARLVRTVATMNDVMMEFDRLVPLIMPTALGGIEIEFKAGDESLALTVDHRQVVAAYDNGRTGETWEGPLTERRDAVRRVLQQMSV